MAFDKHLFLHCTKLNAACHNLLGMEPSNEKEIKRLIKQLGSRNTQKAEAARQELLKRPDAVEALIEVVYARLKPSQRNERRFLSLSAVLAVWMSVWMVIIVYLYENQRDELLITGVFIFIFISGLLYSLHILTLLYGVYCSLPSRFYSRILQLLGELEDVRATGALLEAYFTSKLARRIAYESLVSLLPKLTADDENLLNQKQRKLLRKFLKRRKSDDVLLAIQAIKVLGETQAIEAIEWLSRGNGAAQKDPRVLQAAQECLPVLQAQLVKQKSEKTLLRAASPEEEASGVLLRPLDGVIDDSKQLLRVCEEKREEEKYNG